MGEQRTKRLTVKRVEKLKPGAKPYEVPDGGGLYLTVRPNGSKSFNLRYRFGGKPRNLTLGLSAVGLATARELARESPAEHASQRGEDSVGCNGCPAGNDRVQKSMNVLRPDVPNPPAPPRRGLFAQKPFDLAPCARL